MHAISKEVTGPLEGGLVASFSWENTVSRQQTQHKLRRAQRLTLEYVRYNPCRSLGGACVPPSPHIQ